MRSVDATAIDVFRMASEGEADVDNDMVVRCCRRLLPAMARVQFSLFGSSFCPLRRQCI